jgi:hypothetical protein
MVLFIEVLYFSLPQLHSFGLPHAISVKVYRVHVCLGSVLHPHLVVYLLPTVGSI